MKKKKKEVEICSHQHKIATRCDVGCDCNLIHISCNDCDDYSDIVDADWEVYSLIEKLECFHPEIICTKCEGKGFNIKHSL